MEESLINVEMLHFKVEHKSSFAVLPFEVTTISL